MFLVGTSTKFKMLNEKLETSHKARDYETLTTKPPLNLIKVYIKANDNPTKKELKLKLLKGNLENYSMLTIPAQRASKLPVETVSFLTKYLTLV